VSPFEILDQDCAHFKDCPTTVIATPNTIHCCSDSHDQEPLPPSQRHRVDVHTQIEVWLSHDCYITYVTRRSHSRHPHRAPRPIFLHILACSTQNSSKILKHSVYQDYSFPHHTQSKEGRQLLSLKQMSRCQRLQPMVMILLVLPLFWWGWWTLSPLLQADLWWIVNGSCGLRH
jgi:hypothetical protein